jgi:hypothetical protein
MAAGACCAQLLYMKQILSDYSLFYSEIPLYCDSESAINMALDKGDHGHVKHIEIKHCFIRDYVAN